MLPDAALAYDAQQRARRDATLALTRSAWREMGPDFDASWQAQGPRVQLVALSAQLGAARSAEPYVSAVLPQLGLRNDPVAEVVSESFVGTAGDGRPVSTLLDGAVVTAKQSVSAGASAAQALADGGDWLDMALRTLIADTARAAVSAAMTSRPSVSGWVRMLELPSCSRCTVLAGKFFRWNQGFQRHPRCLPAGVVVSGPAVDATTRRWYQGELVVITTASGQQLPITGNHPVLTDGGWLPAHLVEEGSHVLRSTRRQGAGALVVPDEDQVPTRIEDLRCADGMVPLAQVPSAAEDFHGDGGHGQVDVVLADRLLRDGPQTPLVQLAHQEALAGRVAQATRLPLLCTPEQRLHRLLRAAHRGVGVGHLMETLVGCLPAGTHLAGTGQAPDLHTSLLKARTDGASGDAVAAAEAVLALAGRVGGGDVVDRQVEFAPRWDPPAGPFSVQTRAAYAGRGQDLCLRLAGQVALDRVVKVERVEWSGHVYNLTSNEGWYSANGLIVSNCDCRHIPASESIADDLTTDPVAAIEAGQVRGLSKADTRAILEDGADVSQVINAQRGMSTAQIAGRDLKITSEGMTVRGVAGRGLLERGVRPSSVPRLRPESIYQMADDRADAVRLLRRFGYVTT